ncbi:MAG: hypothetical protein PF485_01495 [Bacteroidales bacterium]|jgi:hypothetical protein|nr:hypothetical protein [Bacteroidales bacterium]
MKHILEATLFFLTINLSLFSQGESNSNLIDKDKKIYEESVFNKEFDEDEDTSDIAWKLYERIPEKLPNWVFSPIDINKSDRIIACSDPNMIKKEAFKQAVLRAKAMFALMKYSSVSNITDDYTNLKESGRHALYATKFQDFSLAKAKLVYNNSAIVIINTFYTKYNEAIVLIDLNYKLDSVENKDTLIVKGEHLQIFTEKNFKNEKIEFFNFSIQDNLFKNDSTDFLAQYNYRVINRGFDIYSIYGNNTIEFKERTYNYRTEIDFVMDSTKSELNRFRLTRGLWNGYITGVLGNITILSKQLASHVRNSNDNYILKNEGLIRSIARNNISFWFSSFEMYENQFFIDLNGQIYQ